MKINVSATDLALTCDSSLCAGRYRNGADGRYYVICVPNSVLVTSAGLGGKRTLTLTQTKLTPRQSRQFGINSMAKALAEVDVSAVAVFT